MKLQDKENLDIASAVSDVLEGKKEVKEISYPHKMYESKITWKHGIVNDGTMRIGIFDPDKEKAMEAARQLIMFLRRNKRVVIGGDKEGEDGVPNDAIQKYIDELSMIFFDDQVLDDLEPKGHNSNDKANDIVMRRLKDLGVSIK